MTDGLDSLNSLNRWNDRMIAEHERTDRVKNRPADLTDADLSTIAQPHQPDYDSISSCVCGEVYPCTTLWLVDEVRQLRADAHPGCEAGYCHNCCPEH